MRKHEPQPETSESQSRLSGVRSLPHDEDERPSREDAEYNQSLFTRWGKRRGERKRDERREQRRR